ncbi:MAG: hypothetical protein B6U89_02065 [Desulfurococcales archaeon ex4484_58]|nr:MAG: hypothetical protein B6U89_02065 [Desulfurococcales archaeon ex4484_58]
MTTARQKFLINKFLEKKSVKYKVASRYVAAGFNVRIRSNGNGVHIIAVKNREKYGIHVLYEKKSYDLDSLNSFLEECKKLGLKPVIILYGSGPKLDQEVLSRIEEENIIVRRIRG